jgi:type I restriction enzyme S subunit
MNNNTQYKDSPLGKIPSDWEVKTLESVGHFSKGKGILKDQLTEIGLPCIRYGEIYTTYDFIVRNLKSFISVEVSKESQEIKNGDILFAGSGETTEEIGKSVAYIGDEKAYAGGDVIILSTFESINAEWLSFALETNVARKQKRVLGQGNSVVHIYPRDLSKIKLLLPPLPEQTCIAEVLSTWDKAISNVLTTIEQVELRNKWLMQELLTGKRRLKGFEKTTGYHKTELGLKIPIDWVIVKVKDIFKERKETSNNQTAFPLFSLTIEKGLTGKTDRYERSFLLKNKEENLYKLIYPEDILFNPMNLRFGAITKSKIDKVVSVSAYYNSIYLNYINADVDYFEYLFKTPVFINLYDRIAIGSLIEKKRVHLSNFLELEIPLPNKGEQTSIAQVLQAADKEVQVLRSKLEKLKEQKKGLMQMLLTGKKRLKI